MIRETSTINENATEDFQKHRRNVINPSSNKEFSNKVQCIKEEAKTPLIPLHLILSGFETDQSVLNGRYDLSFIDIYASDDCTVMYSSCDENNFTLRYEHVPKHWVITQKGKLKVIVPPNIRMSTSSAKINMSTLSDKIQMSINNFYQNSNVN